MPGLKDFKTSELESELKKREDIKYKASKILPEENIDVKGLKGVCNTSLKEIVEKGSIDYETKTEVFEIAMKTVYGDDIFFKLKDFWR